MKNYKLSLMGFALVLLVASCKKEDVQQKSSKTTLISEKGSWTSLSNWSKVKVDDSTSTYFSEISDTAITSTVASSGLVLVFEKSGTTIQSLPFQDKSSVTYWYYQISNGVLRIDANNNGASQPNFSAKAFSYFIFTPEKISALRERGKTELDLMQLSYDQAVELSK
jgi:hypothetical protein